MREVILKLLKKGAIVPCLPTRGQFLSAFFLADKPNGKKRLILNLKTLNTFVNSGRFQIEDYRTALKLIQQDAFMATIDLKDAYFLVSIDPKHRKLLRFSYLKNLYKFTCLTFGLSATPYCFTKLMKPILEYLRSQGVICVNYLDDFLIINSSLENCKNSVYKTVNTLQSLGFKINFEKSCLTPAKECKFLGFIYNSQNLHFLFQKKRKR